MQLGDVVLFAVECVVIFIASTLLFDILHYLLHRWGKSRNPLLRTFARWHWVHHAFLDRRMRIHPNLVVSNIFFHVVPEYVTSMAGTLIFLLVFPWPPVAAVALLRTIMLVGTLKDEGMDFNHMTMRRVSGQQNLWWVGPSYHAMHHIYPDNFFSSFANMFDLIFGTTCQLSGRRFAVTGASGALGSALVRRLEKLGAEVRTLKHGEDYAPGAPDGARETLEWADVLVLAHGAKSEDCDNANCRTFVELTDFFTWIGAERLTPPEVWAVGSEAELHGDLGMDSMKAYARSKRAFARHARGYYSSPDLIYRHIVPCGFTSAMGPGALSADRVAAIALFLIRRGFRYVPVTVTTLAFWNYFRFLLLPHPAPTGPIGVELGAAGGSAGNDLLR
jgi:hypothetical protein